MYDDLINALRHCAECDHQGCAADCRFGKEHPLNFICIEYLQREAADIIEELSKENESLGNDLISAVEMLKKKRKPRWIPVAERLPEAKEIIQITDGINVGHGYIDETWYSPFCDIDVEHISHWMPLPEPPEKESES